MRALLLLFILAGFSLVQGLAYAACGPEHFQHAYVRQMEKMVLENLITPEKLLEVASAPAPVNPLADKAPLLAYGGRQKLFQLWLAQPGIAAQWPGIQSELRKLAERFSVTRMVRERAVRETERILNLKPVEIPKVAFDQLRSWWVARDGRMFFAVGGFTSGVRVFRLGEVDPVWQQSFAGQEVWSVGLSEDAKGRPQINILKKEAPKGAHAEPQAKLISYNIDTGKVLRDLSTDDSWLLGNLNYYGSYGETDVIQTGCGLFLIQSDRLVRAEYPPGGRYGISERGQVFSSVVNGPHLELSFYELFGSAFRPSTGSPLLFDSSVSTAGLELHSGDVVGVAYGSELSGKMKFLSSRLTAPLELETDPGLVKSVQVFETKTGRVLVTVHTTGSDAMERLEVFEPAISAAPIWVHEVSSKALKYRNFRMFELGERAMLISGRSDGCLEVFEPAPGFSTAMSEILIDDNDMGSVRFLPGVDQLYVLYTHAWEFKLLSLLNKTRP